MVEMNLEIRNSFCKLTGDVPANVRELVKEVLTYRNDIDAELGQLFFQLNQAKRFNNTKMYHMTLGRISALKKSEWVCWFHDDVFPTGHLNIVREVVKTLSTKCREIDHRKVPTNSLVLKWNNKPHEMRYYQREMIELGLKEGRGVFEAAVGSGKSLVAGYLIKELSMVSLVIVPSVGLGLQLENDFVSWFGRHAVETVDSKRVRSGKKLAPIRIATVQTLASLQKSGEIQSVLKDVEALFVDEIHHAGSASYTNLLNELDHIYYRFGFTGTFLRNDSKSLDMWGFLSNVLFRYPAHRAIEEGYLTPIEVNIHELQGKPNRSYPKEYDNNYCGSQVILNKVLEICNQSGDNEQILILVKNKDKAGLIFHEFLKMHGFDNMYISGDDKKEVVNNTIKAFNDKRFRILIGSSVIGEGIDIKSTDVLIMCQGGKSEIVIVQAVGRAVRLFEGKNIAKIHDFDFLRTKYMKKHTVQRIDIYGRNFECPINRISCD
jgi:superfamily II DNA or RNA helicase